MKMEFPRMPQIYAEILRPWLIRELVIFISKFRSQIFISEIFWVVQPTSLAAIRGTSLSILLQTMSTTLASLGKPS